MPVLRKCGLATWELNSLQALFLRSSSTARAIDSKAHPSRAADEHDARGHRFDGHGDRYRAEIEEIGEARIAKHQRVHRFEGLWVRHSAISGAVLGVVGRIRQSQSLSRRSIAAMRRSRRRRDRRYCGSAMCWPLRMRANTWGQNHLSASPGVSAWSCAASKGTIGASARIACISAIRSARARLLHDGVFALQHAQRQAERLQNRRVGIRQIICRHAKSTARERSGLDRRGACPAMTASASAQAWTERARGPTESSERTTETRRRGGCGWQSLETNHAIQRSGDSDGTAGVGSDGEIGDAERDGNAGAGRRAAGNAIARHGVARRSPVRIEAQPGIGEFRHVGFAKNDSAGLAQPMHHDRIGSRRRRVTQDRRTGRRRLPGDVEEVLDCDDVAVQRSETPPKLKSTVGGVGGRPCRADIEPRENGGSPSDSMRASAASSLSRQRCAL